MHCFYLGQSGSGKTNSLTERLCSLFKAGQKIVVLDTSDSFTKEAMIKNFSAGGDSCIMEQAKKFVSENVTFHKIEQLGVPVDILKLEYPSLLETKRKTIDSIVSAHIPNMGKVQKAALRNGINDLISEGKLNMIDLYVRLTDEQLVSDSLAMQFEDMLSCFLEYKLSEKSWKEFLDESKNIIVISTDAISGSGGSALVDMLLMSLFYYQRNSPTEHIAVFIDEIQNQNFSPNGAIPQILKEGRKYHISLNYATQFLPTGNKDMIKVMNLASLKVFLQPDDYSAKSISKTIGIPASELCAMNQGECYISGTLYNHAAKSTKNGIIHGFTYRNFVPFKKNV
jgi:DNA phosphorothioation-dependent restriction protein DptH